MEEAKARSLALLKSYITKLDGAKPRFVIGAHHRLFQIEKILRMAMSDRAARPIYHRTRDSIEVHLTIVCAALAISRWIEDTTGWSIKKFVKTARRYHKIKIQAVDTSSPQPTLYRPASAPPSSHQAASRGHCPEPTQVTPFVCTHYGFTRLGKERR
jgi:hypothetical protein